MDSFLTWLEATSFSIWMREEPSILAFPAILAVHTVGMGFVAGLSAAIDLRILGVAAQVPVPEMRRFLPVLWVGFWLNAASGVALLIGYPTKALTNPVFYLKLLCIGIAIALLRRVGHRLFTGDHPDEATVRQLRPAAIVSLVCWAGAIFAGRLLAYTYRRLMADSIAG
jgi:hypothetical protein